MRALAAFMVVMHHVAWKGEQYSADPLAWFNVGGAGVDLFFVISGYIMCHTAEASRPNVSSFMWARLRRIYPLYFLLTTLALLVFIFFPGRVNSSGGTTDIINSYTLFPSEGKYLINNGWTLSYEFFYYFLFSFCLSFSSNFRYIIPLALISMLVFFGFLLDEPNYLIDFITDPLLLEFGFGISIFMLHEKIRIKPIIGLLFISLSIVLLLVANNFELNDLRVLSYGGPAFLFFWGMLSFEDSFKKRGSNWVLATFKALGDSSYSLYLFHPFAIGAVTILLTRMGINGYGYIFVLMLSVVALASGHLCYYFVEKPLLSLFRTNKRKQAAQPSRAAATP